MTQQMEEPWLRGTHPEIEPVVRSLIYSIEMAREDIAKWCGSLDDAEIHAQPFALALGRLPIAAYRAQSRPSSHLCRRPYPERWAKGRTLC